jgi:hypothetical protein
MIGDPGHVRILGGLPDTLDDTALGPFFNPADRRLKEWVGEEAYADADLPSPTDPERSAALRDAEAYLVLYYSAPRLNMVLSGSGIVTYQSDTSTTDELTFLKPDQLEVLRQGWLNDAVTACKQYIIKAGVTVGIAPAKSED